MEVTGYRHRSELSGTDLGNIRELLANARGYAVLGRDLKRVGTFIELGDADGDRIAIRRDGIFLWRRELLPLARVARVLPERRAILLDAEDPAIYEEPVDDLGPASEDIDWRRRIARYVEAAENHADNHLRFISTPSGYAILEVDGRPPSLGSTVDVQDHLGPFLVLRLGPSPLPNDDRICAYLAPR